MLISRTCFAGLIGLLLTASIVHAGEYDGSIIITTPDGLFTRATGRPDEKLADAAHYLKVDAESGREYVLLGWNQVGKNTAVWLKVLGCDAAGSVRSTRVIADQKIADITAIVLAENLGDGRLFIECHVNPKQSVGIAVDLSHGPAVFFRGSGFIYPESGRHIAYSVETPGGTIEVWIDGKKVRQVPADEFVGLSWNSHGTRLTANLSSPGKVDGGVVMTVADDAAVATSN